jgi:hypothetical protein
MANVQSAVFAALMPSAYRDGVEVSLSQLFRALELPDGMPILERAEVVVATLRGIGLGLLPPIKEGDFDSSRVMRLLEQVPTPLATINAEIAAGEAEAVEFKSSYLFDRDQARARPDVPARQLSTTIVVHAVLKTICAFANTRGGTLLVGVEDNGNCIGIEDDYKICAPDGGVVRDEWQLRLRQDIEASFKDGKAVNDFVSVSFAEPRPGVTVARVTALQRKRLVFLKKGNGSPLPYRRQGNRSIEIPYEDIEDFLARRWQGA